MAEKTVFGAVSDSGSGLEQFGGLFGTIVSASFLFLIGLLNLVILAGIVRVFASMRRGEYDEAELERQLENRGFFYRFFGRWMKAITKEWQLYPVGVRVRPGLRHRHRGRAAGHHRAAGLAAHPLVRDHAACRSCSPRA